MTLSGKFLCFAFIFHDSQESFYKQNQLRTLEKSVHNVKKKFHWVESSRFLEGNTVLNFMFAREGNNKYTPIFEWKKISAIIFLKMLLQKMIFVVLKANLEVLKLTNQDEILLDFYWEI